MEKKPLKHKKVWVAMLLNCIIVMMGLGYIYIGKAGKFAAVFGFQLFSLMPMELLGLGRYNGFLLFCVWIYTMIDIYQETKKHNIEVEKQTPKPVVDNYAI